MRRIEARIGPFGEVEMDFGGFPGKECLEEAGRLAEALRRLGLDAVAMSIVEKPAEEVFLESGRPLSSETRV